MTILDYNEKDMLLFLSSQLKGSPISEKELENDDGSDNGDAACEDTESWGTNSNLQ
jgi:hypothetical protein